MPPLDVLLEFLRQMCVVVKVRRHLLHAWRRVMLFGDVEFGRYGIIAEGGGGNSCCTS